jgi:hypothetical protein
MGEGLGRSTFAVEMVPSLEKDYVSDIKYEFGSYDAAKLRGGRLRR